MVLTDDVVRPEPVMGRHTVAAAGTRMVWFHRVLGILFAPVFRTLPPLLVEHTGDHKVSTVITATVRNIGAGGYRRSRTELMLGRMMELLFVEVLRSYAARLPASAAGWLRRSRIRLSAARYTRA